jgi:hypothetical protein
VHLVAIADRHGVVRLGTTVGVAGHLDRVHPRVTHVIQFDNEHPRSVRPLGVDLISISRPSLFVSMNTKAAPSATMNAFSRSCQRSDTSSMNQVSTCSRGTAVGTLTSATYKRTAPVAGRYVRHAPRLERSGRCGKWRCQGTAAKIAP